MNAAGIFTVAVLVLTTAACDEDRGPTAPKPVAQSPDSITNIRVTIPPTRGLDANTVGIGLDAFPRAIATRADGTAVDVTELATWQSSDAAIVKIERQRFPVGVTVGTALLSATYQAVTGTQVVTTRTCVSWELYGRPMLWLGQSVDFVAHAYDACLLSETYIRPLWSTLNPSVAVLEPSSDQPSRIKVVGRHPGTAVIKASVSGASLDPLEHTKPVTVLSFRRPPPEFVWFNFNNPMLVGESGQLEGGADWFTPIEWREDATGGAWKSSNRSVVSITPSGFYNARRTGTTILSLEFEGTRRDVEIVVVAP